MAEQDLAASTQFELQLNVCKCIWIQNAMLYELRT
jgi:hypothetical protein